MTRGLEHFNCEERLRKLDLLRLEKRKLQREFIEAFQYIKGSYKKDEEGLFTVACSDSIRDNAYSD